MKVLVTIPARFASTRFPGKPLIDILGKPMIIWTAEACEKSVGKENVIIATEDKKIKNVCAQYGFNSILTSKDALTGTDRVAEISKKIKADIYVNVQGDEPMVSPKDISTVIKEKIKNYESVINGYAFLSDNEQATNVNIPKLVTNEKNELVYMSRQSIPGSKSGNVKNSTIKKQICIYAFSEKELIKFSEFGRKSELEKIEDIEILRFLELNIKVKMVKMTSNSYAVDVLEDVEKVKKAILSIKKNK